MKSIYILFLVIAFPALVYSQQATLLTALDNSINETSGLIYLNQKLITHNDSGGEPALYEIDSVSGNVTRTIVIGNATNVDWEDLCNDETYIYIADFGNNNGSRTDLKIYRLLISDYFTTANDTVTADTIHFSYADQTDFNPSFFSTNFDAEALISYNDSLYVFTKNWGNNWTNIYALPKTPGTYQISKVDSINAQGLVTSATYDSLNNTILQTGYTFTSPFILEIKGFSANKFSNGTIARHVLQTPTGFSIQVEGVTVISENQYMLTAEDHSTGSSALYKLNTKDIMGVEDINRRNHLIYPNPATNQVTIETSSPNSFDIHLTDIRGRPVLQAQNIHNRTVLNTSGYGAGVYILKITSNGVAQRQKLVIE